MDIQKLRKQIAQRHWHILDAYLNGYEIYWYNYAKQDYHKLNTDFINGYDENWIYQAVPKTLKNCYCEASELHKNILDKSYDVYGNNYKNWDYVCIYPDSKQYGLLRTTGGLSELNDNHKKVQYNEQLKQWTYCPYEEREGERNKPQTKCNDDISANNAKSDIISNSTEINNFKDYGFEANFEGEILKEIDGLYIGWVKIQEVVEPIVWTKNGTTKQFDNYNLTPIKKEWYLDDNSVGKAFFDIVEINVVLINTIDKQGNVTIMDDPQSYRHERFRPATKEETLSLLYNNN